MCRRRPRRRPMAALPMDERTFRHNIRRGGITTAPPMDERTSRHSIRATRSYGSADVPPQHPPTRSYGSTPYGRADMPDQDQRLVWKSSPRWATAKPKAKTSVVKRDPQAKFKAAQAKAAEVGVENLTKEDIDGLNLAEIKQLRGY